MPFVIAVLNLKGGTGKSTVAVNLACSLVTKGRAVTLVDADPQATASAWAGAGKLPVACESMPLETAKDVQKWASRFNRIETPVIVIDCPPFLGAAGEVAVSVADLVLIPVGASAADLLATRSALDLLARGRTIQGGKGPACLMVPSRVDRRTAIGRQVGDALGEMGEPVAPPLYQRTAFVESISAGEWIGQYAPESAAHEDLKALTATVEKAMRKR